MPFFTKVDRYFIRKYLWTTLAWFLAIGLLCTMYQTVERADDITALYETHPTDALQIIGKFCVTRYLGILHSMGIFLLFAGGTFTFYLLEWETNAKFRGGEIIPVLISGFPRWRVAIPFFYTSVVLVLLFTVVEEVLFPLYCTDWPGAKSESFLPDKEISLQKRERDPLTKVIFSAERLTLEKNQLEMVRVQVPQDGGASARIMDSLRANEAEWLAATEEHPAGFLLHRVNDLDKKQWLTDEPSWESSRALDANGKKMEKVFYTHSDAAWVPEGDLFIRTVVTPNGLREEVMTFIPKSLANLYQRIQRDRENHLVDMRIQLHQRIVQPILNVCLMFTMFSIVLSGRLRVKWKISMFLFVLLGFFWAIPMICRTLGNHEIFPPYVAAWLPVFFFCVVCSMVLEELYT